MLACAAHPWPLRAFQPNDGSSRRVELAEGLFAKNEFRRSDSETRQACCLKPIASQRTSFDLRSH